MSSRPDTAILTNDRSHRRNQVPTSPCARSEDSSGGSGAGCPPSPVHTLSDYNDQFVVPLSPLIHPELPPRSPHSSTDTESQSGDGDQQHSPSRSKRVRPTRSVPSDVLTGIGDDRQASKKQPERAILDDEVPRPPTLDISDSDDEEHREPQAGCDSASSRSSEHGSDSE